MKNQKCSFNKVKDFINSNEFPCFFAKTSLKRNTIKVFFIKEKSVKKISFKISENLLKFIEYYEQLSNNEKRFSTCLIVLTSIKPIKNKIKFTTDILKNLEKSNNKFTKIDVFFEKDYTLNLHNRNWFPVLVSQKHNILRKSPLTMIGFQPQETFDVNKYIFSNSFEKIRSAIHRKIDHTNLKPDYMMEIFDGCNLSQFAGSVVAKSK
jgi:FPC/CPF motif-containing protein YcgG